MGEMRQVYKSRTVLQSQGLDPDDPTNSYMLQAGARLCKCLGAEFVPYLAVVMPPLLQAAELKPDINVQTTSDSEEDSDLDDEVSPLTACMHLNKAFPSSPIPPSSCTMISAV